MAVHEGVKYPCRQCFHKASTKTNLARHQGAVHRRGKSTLEKQDKCKDFFLVSYKLSLLTYYHNWNTTQHQPQLKLGLIWRWLCLLGYFKVSDFDNIKNLKDYNLLHKFSDNTDWNENYMTSKTPTKKFNSFYKIGWMDWFIFVSW